MTCHQIDKYCKTRNVGRYYTVFGGFENITIWQKFNLKLLLEESGQIHIFFIWWLLILVKFINYSPNKSSPIIYRFTIHSSPIPLMTALLHTPSQYPWWQHYYTLPPNTPDDGITTHSIPIPLMTALLHTPSQYPWWQHYYTLHPNTPDDRITIHRFPTKMWKQNSLTFPWLFSDFQWNFPDHFIDNWLSSDIVCKYIRRISVSEITNSIWYLYCI